MRWTFVFLPLIFACSFSWAGQAETYLAIAEELFDDGKFGQAIEKCSKVLADEPGNEGCKAVIEKSKKQLAVISAKKKQKAEAAKKQALKEEAEEAAATKKKEAQEQAAEAAEKARLDSPEYNIKKACTCAAAESFLITKVNEEKQAGAIGGMVNKKRLYDLSKQIQMIQKSGGYFKSKAGPGFDPKKCETKEKGWDLTGACLNGTPNDVFQ